MLLAPFQSNKNPTPEPKGNFPYGKRDAFLSPAEISFYHVLQKALTPEQYLLTKVNLADLFFVKQPHLNKGAMNRINCKHVDFLICDAATMEPIIALELDDSSHQRPDRQVRDAFVDQVFAAAELPLIHVPAARNYTVEELHPKINTPR